MESIFGAHFVSLRINYHTFIISLWVINININKYMAHRFGKITFLIT